jgi:hypothetical protein
MLLNADLTTVPGCQSFRPFRGPLTSLPKQSPGYHAREEAESFPGRTTDLWSPGQRGKHGLKLNTLFWMARTRRVFCLQHQAGWGGTSMIKSRRASLGPMKASKPGLGLDGGMDSKEDHALPYHADLPLTRSGETSR